MIPVSCVALVMAASKVNPSSSISSDSASPCFSHPKQLNRYFEIDADLCRSWWNGHRILVLWLTSGTSMPVSSLMIGAIGNLGGGGFFKVVPVAWDVEPGSASTGVFPGVDAVGDSVTVGVVCTVRKDCAAATEEPGCWWHFPVGGEEHPVRVMRCQCEAGGVEPPPLWFGEGFDDSGDWDGGHPEQVYWFHPAATLLNAARMGSTDLASESL